MENSQRDGKGVAAEDGDTTVNSTNDGLKCGSRPPPSERFRTTRDEDDDNDSRFHPRVRLDFPTFDGKDDPLPWINRCKTFLRGRTRRSVAGSGMR